MNDIQIDDLLQKIEDELQDNLDGIVHLSPKEFSTEALHELRKEWEVRYKRFQQGMKWCNISGFTAMISFIISSLLFFIGYILLSKVFLVLFGVCLLTTIIGFAILFKKYGAGIKQQYIQKAIDKELEIRSKVTQ